MIKRILSSEYFINSTLISTSLQKTFFQLDRNDEDTRNFESECKDEFLSPRALWKDITATILKKVLGFSQTDANSITNRGQMYVISKKQLMLLDFGIYHSKATSLLDIGAGDGSITARLSVGLKRVVCTESSKFMRKSLLEKSFEVLEPSDLSKSCETFDIVLCLNVLDRCSTPITLLQQLKSKLKDTQSTLVLAIVLPWCPFVELDNEQVEPEEILFKMNGYACKNGASFEESLNRLVEEYILPVGFHLTRWTKVPYISKGDRFNSLYTLSDAVLVLRKLN